jgi:hypothetical protein
MSGFGSLQFVANLHTIESDKDDAAMGFTVSDNLLTRMMQQCILCTDCNTVNSNHFSTHKEQTRTSLHPSPANQ